MTDRPTAETPRCDGGVAMWEFTCPDCGTVEYRLVPEEGDEIECTDCGWSQEVAEVRVTIGGDEEEP